MVDYNDLQRIREKLQSGNDWCRVWSEMGAEHEALADRALEAGHRITATEAYKRATIYYHFANAIFYQDKVQRSIDEAVWLPSSLPVCYDPLENNVRAHLAGV